jgi:hypothetical protein
VTNGFAAERDVTLFDYPGIGGSSGETPSTVAALTKACVEFCRALDFRERASAPSSGASRIVIITHHRRTQNKTPENCRYRWR